MLACWDTSYEFSGLEIFPITHDKVKDLRVRMVIDTQYHENCKIKLSNLETLQLEKYRGVEKVK